MMAAIRVGIKILKWVIGLFTGGNWKPGQNLPGVVKNLPIPKPTNQRGKDKVKAMEVENEIMEEAAKHDTAEARAEIKEEIEVKDEEGDTTGFNFS
jgi:hypothetical protein